MSMPFGPDDQDPRRIARNARRFQAELEARTRLTYESDAAQALLTSAAVGNLKGIRREVAEAVAEDPAGAALYNELSATYAWSAKNRLLRFGL